MGQFCVSIMETITQNFLVEAESPQEAVQKIKDSYNACETVVDNGELVKAEVRCVYGPNNSEEEETDWEDIDD